MIRFWLALGVGALLQVVVACEADSRVSAKTRVGGRVWLDLDGDGRESDDEHGIPGVTVCLTHPGMTQERTEETTDDNGRYTFVGSFPPGQYKVEVVDGSLPPGWRCGGCSDSACSPRIVTLERRSDGVVPSQTDIDFGIRQEGKGSVGDLVWLDENCSGLQDEGEPGIDGVPVRLRDATGVLVAETVTAPDAFGMSGHYEFSDLCEGTYTVEVDESMLACLELTRCDVGNDDTRDSECNPSEVVILDNDSVPSVDFGFCPLEEGMIGDRVWLDKNCNGLQDDGEPGFGGIEISLAAVVTGEVISQTRTDETGHYQFVGLCQGEYKVRLLALPEPFELSPPEQGEDRTRDSNPSNAPVRLSNDTAEDRGIDFGVCSRNEGQIGDLVWNDLNEDGLQQVGEPGLAGIRVVLRHGAGTYISEKHTDSEGRYHFESLGAGMYMVEVDVDTLPSCFSASPCTVGDDRTIDSTCMPAEVTLLANDLLDKSVDFGFHSDGEGIIGDFVWCDANRNGVQDERERGLVDVQVILRSAEDGEIVAKQRTGAGGFYSFTGLCAGTYLVAALAPEGLVPSPCETIEDETRDSDCMPAKVVLLKNDSINDAVDFGFNSDSHLVIGDLVWNDLDGDGLQEDGEPGIEGVKVLLRHCESGVERMDVTDADGLYEFDCIEEGCYRLEIDPTSLPAGLVAAPCEVGVDRSRDSDCTPVVIDLPQAPDLEDTYDFGFVPTTGDKGCSPGFWKQPEHWDSWPATFAPDTLFAAVFEDTFPGATLLDVISLRDGGLDALGRHVVAAVLNAESADVEYPLTTAEVIQLFDDLHPASTPEYNALKDFLDELNNLGCGLR